MNGSISQVNALKIASIVAGTETLINLSYRNAVRSLSEITAKVIGANVTDSAKLHVTGTNGKRFDFGIANKESDHFFQPDGGVKVPAGDFPLDGIALVQAGGLLAPLPVVPLKLVEIPAPIDVSSAAVGS